MTEQNNLQIQEIKLEDKSEKKIELFIKANNFLMKNNLIMGSILAGKEITINLEKAEMYNDEIRIVFKDNSFKKIKKIIWK